MKNRTNVRWLTQLALLVAILLVLNYTPLGYLQIGPLSASLLTVPVAIRRHDDGSHGGRNPRRRVRRNELYSGAGGQVRNGQCPVSGQPVRRLRGQLCGPRADGPVCRPDLLRHCARHCPKRKKLCCFLGGLAAPC